MKKLWFVQIAIFVCLAGTSAAAAADTPPALSGCVRCHALTAPSNPGLDHIWERGGPDLYYAGIKFNKSWLVNWLQDPRRIRPAGEFYTRHIKKGDETDEIDTATLQPHLKLSAAEAEAAATALMQLTGPAGLVQKGAFQNQTVSATIGALFFGKLRGCSACHQGAPDAGGRSGPELYTAAQRLQMDYVVEYIRNPQKFDPGVWMPRLSLTETDVQRLSSYIVQIGHAPEGK
jgi:mono/diheme cytochrome c family protein